MTETFEKEIYSHTPTMENLYQACHNNCLEAVDMFARKGHFSQLSIKQRRKLAATSMDIAQIFLLHGVITSNEKTYIDKAHRLIESSNNNSEHKFS